MCGIAGIFLTNRIRNSAVDMLRPEHIGAMIGSIAHRGPDAEGVWRDLLARCVLGHRRLSIIDTSEAGRQPRISGDGRYVITFNGELYNYRELAALLKAANVLLRGRTDTEVLLEAYALWGEAAWSKFDGMFACAIFDKHTGTLLLARDPFGEKPLYFTELSNGAIAFASELQALERLPGFDPTVDVDAVAEVLAFQYIGAPRSIYRNVKKLCPGEWIRIEANGQTHSQRYFQYRPGLSGYDHRPIGDLADELEAILLRSIEHRLMSDVPLGAFLSGGVDSSTVCALIRRKLKIPLKTFSIGFKGAPESEHITARAFADYLGTEHHEQVLNPSTSDFLRDAGRLIDEPNGDSSCLPTYLLSRFARQHVTVAISGDGGDEMFGGYGRYFATLDELAQHQTGHLPGWSPGAVYYGNRILVMAEPQIEELLGFIPPLFSEHISQMRDALNHAQGRLLTEMRRQDAEHYMPGAVLTKVDRMSMQHGLEVRTPYLNVELARFAQRLPDDVLVDGNRGKLILRQVAYRYLPRNLIDLPKAGFGLPLSDWARDGMLAEATRLLEQADGRLRNSFGPNGIDRFLARQRSPGNFSPYQVWNAVVLEAWLRHHPAELAHYGDNTSSRPQARFTNSALMAAPTGPKEYVVSEITRRDTFASASWNAEAARLRRSLARMDCDVCDDGSIAEASHLCLPDWGSPLSEMDRTRLRPLRGTTLFFLDESAIERFDTLECQKMLELGVSRVVLRYADSSADLIEIAFRPKIGKLRLRWQLARLARHRLAWFSNRRLHRLLGARAFEIVGDRLGRSGLVKKIEPLPDIELAPRFAVFQGTRQLSPVPCSRTLSTVQCDGRYSVWNQEVTLSPTHDNRNPLTSVYWIVRNDNHTRPVLPIVATPRKRRVVSRSHRSILLDNLFRSAPGEQNGNLQQGDAIAVLTHSLEIGGAQHQWIYLAQALRELGYEATIVVCDSRLEEHRHYQPIVEAGGIPLVAADRIPLDAQLKCWPSHVSRDMLNLDIVPMHEVLLRAVTALAQIRPKIVFCQLDYPNIAGALAAHVAGVPRIVLSFRNHNPDHFPYLKNDWFQPAYRELVKSERVILTGNSRSGNDDYAGWIGIERNRVFDIPNAIDPEVFPVPPDADLEKLRRELDLPDMAPVIFGAFRLSFEKDPFTFVQVCAKVIEALPNSLALIAGEGPLEAVIRRWIEELGLESRIRLLGRRSDINALMRLSSVLLLTSTFEGMPNVIMEAQLMGIPVVATAVGGTPEVVIDGETAILTPVGDIDALTRATVGLLCDPGRSRQMGQQGRNFVLSRFSRRCLVERHLEVALGTWDGGQTEEFPMAAQ